MDGNERRKRISQLVLGFFFKYKLIFLTVFYQRRWLPVVCHLRHGDWRVPVAIAIAGPAVANVAKSPMSGRFISRVEFSWVLPGFYRVLPGFTGFFFGGGHEIWMAEPMEPDGDAVPSR